MIAYVDSSAYALSIGEFRDGKVARQTQYLADPFVAPAWRAQWVDPAPA